MREIWLATRMAGLRPRGGAVTGIHVVSSGGPVTAMVNVDHVGAIDGVTTRKPHERNFSTRTQIVAEVRTV